MKADIVSKIKLSDNRFLAYEEYGDPKGTPLIYLHGTYSSRYEGKLSETAAKKHKVRLLSVDRPGYGQSTYNENLTIKKYANDIIEFADRIGLDSFNILGISGGAPYACSVALQHHNRINKLILVSGLCDFSGWGIEPDFRYKIVRKTVRDNPKTVEKTLNGILTIYYTAPKQLYLWYTINSSKMDNDYKKTKYFEEHFYKYGEEAFANGAKGAIKDLQLFLKKWDISPEQLEVETHIWHGTEDKTVPIIHGKTLHKKIKKSKFNIVEGGGHYIMFYKNNEIFEKMLNN